MSLLDEMCERAQAEAVEEITRAARRAAEIGRATRRTAEVEPDE